MISGIFRLDSHFRKSHYPFDGLVALLAKCPHSQIIHQNTSALTKDSLHWGFNSLTLELFFSLYREFGIENTTKTSTLHILCIRVFRYNID